MWERGWSFIKKAGTIILLSTIVLWFLMNFGWSNGTFGMLDFDGLEGAALEAAQAECVLAKVAGHGGVSCRQKADGQRQNLRGSFRK